MDEMDEMDEMERYEHHRAAFARDFDRLIVAFGMSAGDQVKYRAQIDGLVESANVSRDAAVAASVGRDELPRYVVDAWCGRIEDNAKELARGNAT